MLAVSSYRQVTCSAKVCILPTWCRRAPTTVTRPRLIRLVWFCWERLRLETCKRFLQIFCSVLLSHFLTSAFVNRHELKKASHITKLPKGKHSVKGKQTERKCTLCMFWCENLSNRLNVYFWPFKGLGRTAPDPRATTTLNGVDVPLGKGTNTNIDDTSLLYNEYPLHFHNVATKRPFVIITCIICFIQSSFSLSSLTQFSPGTSCTILLRLTWNTCWRFALTTRPRSGETADDVWPSGQAAERHWSSLLQL